MTAEPDRPGTVDCLRRGLRSLRANWELVPVLVAQSWLTVLLLLAGCLILLAGLGVSIVTWVRGLGPDWHRQLAEDLVTTVDTGPPALLPLVAPLIAASIVWTVAFALYCYLQGGVVGTLVEGEMAAAAGSPGWRSFRRVSVAGFDHQGRRLFWRYFWYYHLLGALALVAMLLLLGLIALAMRLATQGSTEVGVAVGCVGLVPLALLLVAATLWSLLANIEVARPGASVRAASWRALGTLRQRPVPVVLIFLAALAAGMVASAALAPLDWLVVIAAGDSISAWLGGRAALMLAETLALSALSVALMATLAGLVDLPAAADPEARR